MIGSLKDLLLHRLNAELKRREERARTIRAAIAGTFEVSSDRSLCIRRLDVVEHVAAALGEMVINNALFAEVEAIAREMGFQPVKNGNRSLFRCAKHKDLDQDEAMVVSRANRRDQRSAPKASPGSNGVLHPTG